MKFGAHISTAKPFSDCIVRAREIGCECMQIFVNPPQRWNPVPITEEEISRYQELNNQAQINPVIIHSIYLVNLASENSFFYQASIKSLSDDMVKAEKLGAFGINTHLGSTKGKEFKEVLPKVVDAIQEVLKAADSPSFIIENAAGAGNIIGDTLPEIAEIVKAVGSDRIKVIIDTAHAFASGYDLRSKESVARFVEKVDSTIGLDCLSGFHFNDSKAELSSKRDRHADLGEGFIGQDAFKYLINHPQLKDKFAILETPQDHMSWDEQIRLLKEMRSSE